MSTFGSEPLRLLLDLDTRVAAIDSRLASELGYDPAELLDTPFSSMLDPASYSEVGKDLVDLVNGERQTATSRRVLRTADGDPLPVILSAKVRNPNGGEAVSGFTIAVLLDDENSVSPPLLPDHMRRLSLAAAVIDPDDRIVDTNLAWGQLFASQEAVTPGGSVGALVVPDDLDLFVEQLSQVRSTEEPARFDARCTSQSGVFWCRFGVVPLDARRRHVTLTAEDISAEQLTRRILETNEALFRSITEASPIGVARLTTDLSIVYANPAWVALTDAAGESTALKEVISDSDRDVTMRTLEQRVADDDRSPVRCRFDERLVDLRLAPIAEPDIGTVGFVAIAEEAHTPTSAPTVGPVPGVRLANGGELVGVADLRTGELLHLNDTAAEYFGLTGVSGLTEIAAASLYAPEERSRYADEIYPALRRGETWTGELEMIDGTGQRRTVLQSITADLGADGEPERAQVVGTDLANGAATQDQLVYLATHDQLTGLPNRGLFRDHLDLALARSARDRRPIAVLFIDLDRFKTVNDTHGHDVGDELLRLAAQRMSDVLRPSDTVARIGGDEFIVLCEDIDDAEDAMLIARRIRDALSAGDLTVRDLVLDVAISVGVALSNGGAGSSDGDTLIRQADAAMYRAKQSGRARIELYDDVLRDRTQRRSEMTDQLQHALDRQELEVHYQPIVDLTTGKVVGVEAFVRWVHPTSGLLYPGDFLDLAVDTGLDLQLDQLVIERACQDAARWHESMGEAAPRVHINVTARSALSGSLPAALDRCLRLSGLPADKLCLELSERFLMEGGELAEARLDQIRSVGVSLAIDDVGTAATSLTQLRRYRLDVLKVDGSLVAAMDTDAGDAVVGAAVALGRAMDLQVSIEGVEDPATIDRLRRLGADVAQGHVFAEAMPAARLEPLLPLRSALARSEADRRRFPDVE